MLTLCEFQFAHYDAQATDAPEEQDNSACFAVWPALDGMGQPVKVRISTRELSDVSGHKFGIDTYKIRQSLLQLKALIEQEANIRYRAGDHEVTLDVGALRGA